MQRKSEQQDDPYELIRRLRGQVQTQKIEMDEYQLVLDSLFNQKNAALRQAAQLRQQMTALKHQLETERVKRNIVEVSQNMGVAALSRGLSLATLASPARKQDIIASQLSILATPNNSTLKKQAKKQQDFVPGDVHFVKKKGTQKLVANESFIESSESIGEFLLQDVMVVAPDVAELKRQRQDQRFAQELVISKYSFFNHNTFYKAKKEQYLLDVAQRCFPMGAIATRRTVQNVEEFKMEMESRSNPGLADGFFVFNLKGDFAVPPHNQRVMFGGCNPFRGLFAVCLKVPDFVPIREESRHMRNETVVWMVEKVYVALTYYPFFQLHFSLLKSMSSALQPKWQLLHRQEVFSRNLTRNLAEAQKHQHFSKLASYLRSKRPQHGDICQWQKQYFGCIPPPGILSSHAVSLFAAPLFFSIFAYEQALLLLSALFLQKTIVFMSEKEGAATLCALFMVTCIAPFVYNQALILNCTYQMLDNIVFGFPLTLVASTIKTRGNLQPILTAFIDNNTEHFRGFKGKQQTAPLILVDIDSNTILYDPQLNKTFQNMIVSPSKQLRDAYLAYNPTHSKSFSFPKKMPVQYQSVKPKNDHQKNAEGKKKLLKEYEHKIENNTSKWPIYHPSPAAHHIHHLFTEYISSLGIQQQKQQQFLSISKQGQKKWAKQYLLNRHPDKPRLVETLLQSQLYADYMDRLQGGNNI